MNAVTAHALRRPAVMFLEQGPAVRTLLELRKLIGGQGRVEVVHIGGIGMAARAEGRDPFAIRRAILFRPFLYVGMTEIGCRIAAVTTSARNAPAEMHIFHHLLQVHVGRGTASAGRRGKESVRRVVG